MPFIRVSRDKRGFERTFVMHAYRTGQSGQQTKVLYLFRSPAHVRIGRLPLDSEVVEALEHTHPDLTFDWSALRRDAVRQDIRERPLRGRKESRGSRPPVARRAPARAEDESPLARVAGVAEAARLRAAYGGLLQRITRRARTPEERDRLIDQAARLNPKDWPDEAAVTTGLQTVEAAWDAIVAELPARRRGRRGGRRRDPAGPDSSGIMAEGTESNGESTPDELADTDRAAAHGGARGDLAPVGGADEAGRERRGAAPPESTDDVSGNG